VQWILAVVVLGIDIRAMFDEELHNVEFPAPGREGQRSFFVLAPNLDIDTRLKKEFRDVEMPRF
jgi:hypothetical protein